MALICIILIFAFGTAWYYGGRSSRPVPKVGTVKVSGSSVRALFEAQYKEMDAAYGRKDSAAFYAHHDPAWKFRDRDGTITNIAEARRYFAMRFSPTNKNRFLSCSMTQRIESLKERGDEATVIVVQAVYTETRQRRVRTDIRQEDTWGRQSGTWLCIRSRLLAHKAAGL